MPLFANFPATFPFPYKVPVLVKLPNGSTVTEPRIHEVPVAVTEVLGDMIRVAPNGISI